MRNIEKLRDYFLGKDPYLKETMADNSLRLIGIPGKNFVLRTELLKRLQELRKHVDDADKELQDAIDGVIEDLQAEVITRGDEVTRLDGRIDENAVDIAGLQDWVNNSIVDTIDDETPANTVPNVGAVKAYVGGDGHNYSTTEQEIGTWIDGKPLYEMTISETVAANSISTTNINDVDEIFIKYGTGKVSDLIYQLPHIDGLNDLMASISVLPTYKKVVLSNQSSSSADIMVVVNYTKTTD